MAQSACPQGTVAGGRACGPDDLVINDCVDRYEGYVAYVKPASSCCLYWVKGPALENWLVLRLRPWMCVAAQVILIAKYWVHGEIRVPASAV